jgi:hypothetical protein
MMIAACRSISTSVAALLFMRHIFVCTSYLFSRRGRKIHPFATSRNDDYAFVKVIVAIRTERKNYMFLVASSDTAIAFAIL